MQEIHKLPLKVCIVGGGAAGLIAAYLLRGRHEVTVFEATDKLGGNICTLNVNVPCGGLDDMLVLDAGVIEFEENHFPNLKCLLDELGVERLQVPGSTAVYLNDGRSLRSPGNILSSPTRLPERLGACFDLFPLVLAQRRFQKRVRNTCRDDLYQLPISSLLGRGDHATWLRMLLMYAYSTGYENTQGIPAALAAPMLSDFTHKNAWTTIMGGSYTYIEKMIAAMDAKIVTNAKVETLSRSENNVDVGLASGDMLRFDKVVIATTPEQVLQLVDTPTDDELKWFRDWKSHVARTVVHNDTGLYERRGISYFSEFDLFETHDGAGYSAYLNRLAGIEADYPKHFFLAFNLDHEINEECIVHEQVHSTPSYSVPALRHREEIIRSNGRNNILYAGAWLGDGLHEGAVRSAQRVAEILGGHDIGGTSG